MADTKKNTSLAVMDNFQIVNRYEGMDPELMEQLQDEMEDLDAESGIVCRKIKIPSGGAPTYVVEGEDEGQTDCMQEITGVIVFTHRLNGYWPGAYGSDDNKTPVCSSIDGKNGLNTETGEIRSCATCPLNQYGTATDHKGNQVKAKACKNMRRLYLLMNGDPNIYLLTVPPTSIRDVNKQLAKILTGGIPYTGLAINLKLTQAKNANGVAYSKVVISKSGLLPQATAEAVKVLRQELKVQYKSMAVTSDDYTAPANTSLDIDPDDDDLPFN